MDKKKKFGGSGVAFIDVKVGQQPLDLFQDWFEEVKKFHLSPAIFNLATADLKGNVSNRNVVLMDVKNNGFEFITPDNGRKIGHLVKTENKNVAACFLWIYSKDGQQINKQVRIEGIVEELPRSEVHKYYERSPISAKIRSHVWNQNAPVENWGKLKERHDDFFEKVEGLPLPDQLIGFRVMPKMMDFYYAYDLKIADRIIFNKSTDKWTHMRVEA